jgi:hypothetical protein
MWASRRFRIQICEIKDTWRSYSGSSFIIKIWGRNLYDCFSENPFWAVRIAID